MNQERIIPAPEEQFEGQEPVEINLNEPEKEQIVEELLEEPSNPVKPDQSVLSEPPEGKEVSLFQRYSGLSLPEILLEFDKLLNQSDTTPLMRNAELLKSIFYKGLRRERGGESALDAPLLETPELDEGVEMEDLELLNPTVAVAVEEAEEEDTEASLLFVEEENAFKRMYAKYKLMRTDFIKQQELQKEHNLKLKHTIIDELKTLVEKQEDLNHTFPEFRALQARWKDVGPVPIANTKDVWDTYQHFVEKFYDYVKINNELRDLDFRKNLEQKTLLCAKAEELLLDANALSAFRKLQKLHEEWRESGPVAREHREHVWERFKAATSEINKRHQAYFEGQKEVQKKNLDEKTVLCIKVEEIVGVELRDVHEWNKHSKEVENLQKKWRTIGFASKRENQKIYDRFRAACNTFYEGKRKFYVQYKQEMNENYSQKVALCEQAEGLRESEEWKKTSDLLVNLQRQWKEIGPVSRKHSESIWKRFRTACDAFFEHKSKHFGSKDDSYDTNLKKKEALLKEMGNYEPSKNSSNTLAAFREFQRRWGEIGFVPIKEKERIHAVYAQLLDEKFNTLRSSDTARKPNKGKKRTEDVHSGGKPERTFRSEREKLLAKFRQMESDIAVWENNMGFFAKSKNAENMIAGIERKIALAKEELLQIEEKIKTMDQQFD